jgi:Cyclic nucleotide-binding domain
VAIEPSAKVAFLKKIHLFYGLEDEDFATLAEELDEISVPKGAVIFEQDSKPDGFYLIYEGKVRIARTQDRKETQLALLVKNDYFGEMALVANRRRSATATALTDSTLLMLPRKDFDKLYKRAPHIKTNLEIAVRSRRLARRLTFKWLRSDEVVYFLARKHRVILYESLLLPGFGLLLPLALFYVWWFVVPIMLVFLLALLSFLGILSVFIWRVIDWGNDYYVVTNQRVVYLEKVVGIYDSRQESPLSTILSVGVEANQLGKILDYGNVIIRTFVGRIVFANVDHPNHAARMVEEYWNRTKEFATAVEKEAMKNAIRKRLGLPLPKIAPGFGEPAPIQKTDARPPKVTASMLAVMRFLGTESFKLRYEVGETVIYRKHWIALILDAWISVSAAFFTLMLFVSRLVQLAFLPDEAFISFAGGVAVDAWAVAFLIAFFPFALWFGYQVLDWSNDKFEVTNDQIIDIDRKPFGTEARNAAPLEGIMSTQYERKGLLGNLFNFGTVYITVGGTKMAFEDVIDPATVQSDIDRRRMERNAKKQAGTLAAERDRMAEWLATYHRASQEFRDEERRNQKRE